MLDRSGFDKTDLDSAELVFIVACAVRQTAVDRIFGKLRNWKDKKIIITSCVLPPDKKKFAEKGALYWDYNKPEDLSEILSLDSRKAKILLAQGRMMSLYVPIMTGCNNFCSYCAVPYTKGREASRPMPDIIADVKNIISKKDFIKGSEIMLLGQNVNSYKMPPPPAVLDASPSVIPESKAQRSECDFTRLLEALDSISGNFTISFTSNHPKDITQDIIEAVSSLKKIKKEIHLPVQSGSNRILKLMNRPYTKERYLEIAQSIRTIDKEIMLTTDVIVGFPGETEEDFEQTVDVFKKVNFSKAYVNKYSPRAGTAAYKLGDPIPWSEKQRRWRILDKLANAS